MAGVSLKALTKRYGSLTAVDSLNLEIHDKEFVCLLGPSGAGKTTTLKCIAGLLRPEEGEIHIGGDLVNELSPAERDVAMVFQGFSLFPHMTVFDNLAYPLRERKIERPEIEQRVKEVAEILKITHTLDRRPGTCSGGEMQRICIGKAIIRRPRVFLFDEPLTNLDAKLRHEMRAELKRLHRELGQTLIYATPDQLEATTMGDRVAVIRQGVLQQCDAPSEIYFHPRNRFVAGFVGDPPMNFIDGVLVERSGKLSVETQVFKIDVTDWREMLSSCSFPMDITVGLRPEDLRLRQDGVDLISFPAEVYVVEPLGDVTILDIKIGGDIGKVALTEYGGTLQTGEKISVFFKKERLYLMDREKGNILI